MGGLVSKRCGNQRKQFNRVEVDSIKMFGYITAMLVIYMDKDDAGSKAHSWHTCLGLQSQLPKSLSPKMLMTRRNTPQKILSDTSVNTVTHDHTFIFLSQPL